jgi:hypothetical protein
MRGVLQFVNDAVDFERSKHCSNLANQGERKSPPLLSNRSHMPDYEENDPKGRSDRPKPHQVINERHASCTSTRLVESSTTRFDSPLLCYLTTSTGHLAK